VPLSPRSAGAPPASAVLPLWEGTCSHQLTNRDAPRRAHKSPSELSSKLSCPREPSTSNYITHIRQQCMSVAQPNKPMTAKRLREFARQSAVSPNYLCGLGRLPQQSRLHPHLTLVRSLYSHYALGSFLFSTSILPTCVRLLTFFGGAPAPMMWEGRWRHCVRGCGNGCLEHLVLHG